METLTALDVIEQALIEDDSVAPWKTADFIAWSLVRAGFKVVRTDG